VDLARQRAHARAPFEIDEQSGRQRRQHRRGRHACGVEQVRKPVIAHVQNIERASRAIETARPVKSRTDVGGGNARGRREGRLDAAEQAIESVDRHVERDDVGQRERLPRRVAQPDHVQHGRIAGEE